MADKRGWTLENLRKLNQTEDWADEKATHLFDKWWDGAESHEDFSLNVDTCDIAQVLRNTRNETLEEAARELENTITDLDSRGFKIAFQKKAAKIRAMKERE